MSLKSRLPWDETILPIEELMPDVRLPPDIPLIQPFFGPIGILEEEFLQFPLLPNGSLHSKTNGNN